MTLPAFSLVPEFTVVQNEKYSVLKSSFEGGLILRRAVYDRSVRTFELRWKNTTKAVKDAIVNLFRDRRGRAGAMLYTPIDSETQITVRFADDIFQWNKRQHGNYQFSVKLIEML